MKTDTIFYQLFQSFPSIFFELIQLPISEANNYRFDSVEVKQLSFRPAILISKSNNLYRQKQRFNRWQNCERQSVLDGCNFSYSVIMRVMTFLVGVLKSASSIKMRIAAFRLDGVFLPQNNHPRFNRKTGVGTRIKLSPHPTLLTNDLRNRHHYPSAVGN
jgi:hypothetical protein